MNCDENVPKVSPIDVSKDALSDEDKLIAAIKENPKITTEEMAEVIHKSRRTVTRILSKSTKSVRKGNTYAGHWEVID